MPRTARIIDPAGVYHVICRGNNKMMIFKDDRDKNVYKAIILRTKNLLPFKLLHYVVMGNHTHLLIALQPAVPLCKIMKKISQEYACYHGRRYGFIGHLWQDRYKSILVAKDQYLLTCGIYIEMNPVRANIVQTPDVYEWSSYRYYLFGKNDALIDDDPLYSTLGNTNLRRRITYQRLCVGGLSPTDSQF